MTQLSAATRASVVDQIARLFEMTDLYPKEVADETIAWILANSDTKEKSSGPICQPCMGKGLQKPVVILADAGAQLSDSAVMAAQGICVACRGRGHHPA